MDLNRLASRPAASITDQEVAQAIDIILADPRVTKAVHVGRDSDDEHGRQLIDFDMKGFAGVHTLGRVISALGEEERVQKAAAEKKAATDAKAAKKHAADRADLLKMVPAPGRNGKFEAYMASISQSSAEGDERASAYADYAAPRMVGLTGSIKQRVWAADIREGSTSRFDEKMRAKIFKKHKASKFWIEGSRNPRLADMLDAVK